MGTPLFQVHDAGGLVVPLTHTASCKYGANTKWCTTSSDTNDYFDKYSRNGKRQINIDPGYVSLGKLVLATTKDQQHRIYLKKGIYAEITLRFVDKRFVPWDWTYRDYKSKQYMEVFNKIRSMLKDRARRKL